MKPSLSKPLSSYSVSVSTIAGATDLSDNSVSTTDHDPSIHHRSVSLPGVCEMDCRLDDDSDRSSLQDDLACRSSRSGAIALPASATHYRTDRNGDMKENNTISNSPKSKRRGSAFGGASSHRKKREDRLSLLELCRAAQKSKIARPIYYLGASRIALELCAVLFTFLLVRRAWVLHGTTLVLALHTVKLLWSWASYIAEAREIRQLKGLASWWIRVGLDFSSRTVEGDDLHRILTGLSLNFWNIFGKSYTVNFFKDLTRENSNRVIQQARDGLRRTEMSRIKLTTNMVNTLRSSGPYGK